MGYSITIIEDYIHCVYTKSIHAIIIIIAECLSTRHCRIAFVCTMYVCLSHGARRYPGSHNVMCVRMW